MEVDLSAVLNYYNDCWDERFLDGHNSISHACHYGFYSDPSRNNINNTQSEYDKSKKQLNNKLIEIIDKKYDDKLIMLDAGCGYGGTMLDLSRYFINSNVYGITLTNAQIKCTNELLYLDTANRTKVLYGNFNNDDFDIQNNQNHPIKYDIIYFIESICHSECKETTIKIALSMLNNNGKLIIFDYFENFDDNVVCDDLDNRTIDEIKVGMAIPSFINIKNIENITDNFNAYDVTNHILPGMEYSKCKAQKKIDNGNIQNENIMKHLQSCIHMYNLHSKHILNYNIVVIDKS